MPTPPATTKAPVVVLEDAAAFVTLILLAVATLPPFVLTVKSIFVPEVLILSVPTLTFPTVTLPATVKVFVVSLYAKSVSDFNAPPVVPYTTCPEATLPILALKLDAVKLPTIRSAYPDLFMVPAVVPVSVVNVAMKRSLDSSQANATLVSEPRSITIPASKLAVPLCDLANTINGSATTVLVVSIIVVAPCTVRLPVIVRLLG